MILYIVRHAWAGQHGDPQYPDDSLRPLTEKGAKRFRRMAKRLVKRGFAPSVIATSPLVRCRQTAEILAERLADRTVLAELPELAPGATVDKLLPWTRQQLAEEVAWVGHAPDVGRMVAELIGSGDASVEFAKGAVAAIGFDVPAAPRQGRLLWLVTADTLGV